MTPAFVLMQGSLVKLITCGAECCAGGSLRPATSGLTGIQQLYR